MYANNCAYMVILNIETSTDACSASVTENGKVLEVGGRRLCFLQKEKSEHARQLALYVESLLAVVREAGKEIDAVAVSAGPGSYTGLRIGASTAKGLAYGMNVPLLAIPTLQIMAEAVREEAEDGALLCPMIDARRMEVYNCFYNKVGEPTDEVMATVVDGASFSAELQGGKVYFFGNGSEKCKSVLSSENAVFVDGIVPDAAWMGRLAEEAYQDGRFADVAYWTPFYLKEFEAKKANVKGLN